MKLLWIFLAVNCVAVVSALAEPLAIRSGDHPTFSRITIAIPITQEWEINRSDNDIVITLPGHSGGFDITDVFFRMRRDRISELGVNDSSLSLNIDCACDASAFLSGNLLVIDVADQGTELSGKPIINHANAHAIRQNSSNTKNSLPEVKLPWIGSRSTLIAPPLLSAAQSKILPEVDQASSVSNSTTFLTEIQRDILNEVANSASAGLLQHSSETIASTRIQRERDASTNHTNPQALAVFPSITQGNIRITNSMDSYDERESSISKNLALGVSCPDAASFDLPSWGHDSSFSSQIGLARNALMNARDQTNHEAVRDLAQLYLYFGFGAEAIDVLELDPSVRLAHPHLSDLAAILEFVGGPNHSRLSVYSECPSDVALWASLSLHGNSSDAIINVNAALRALNKLPIHLRHLVAPALSEKLLLYKYPEGAAAAMRNIERLPDALSSSAHLAQTELTTKPEFEVDALLQDVIAANRVESPAALVKLVNRKLERDQPLSSQTATLVEAYAQELRGTELGNQLRQTQVLALGQSGQFQEAFGALAVMAASTPPESVSKIHQALLTGLTKNADDLVFLESVFAQSRSSIAELPTNTKLIVASRMMDLGFASQVQELLETIPTNPSVKRRQLLAARAALALQQPFQAQASLIEVEGMAAEVLLAQAKEMTGAYSEAAELFKNNDADDQATQATWLSEEWTDLKVSDISTLGAAAALATDARNSESATLGPLGRASQALEESGIARATLQNLLSDPFVQVAPDF